MPPPPSRSARHLEMLARWPVLNEAWALRIEQGRPQQTVREVGPGSSQGISLLQAINRASGLPEDHGSDSVHRARARDEASP
ncbi:MAG: hypothetical protein KDC33_12230 [Thermoleophilia bacterium]|nr:hypothetical protein [Thermoleophilia bacterium]